MEKSYKAVKREIGMELVVVDDQIKSILRSSFNDMDNMRLLNSKTSAVLSGRYNKIDHLNQC